MANAQLLGLGGLGYAGIYPGAANQANNTTLSGSGLRMAWIFYAPATDTITHLGFRYNLRTGTPPTYRISFQSVTTSTGFPSGTILGGGSPASATFTPPASTAWDATWQWVALSNSYGVTRGDLLAIVIDYSSGTVDGSNNSAITISNDHFQQRLALPYVGTFNGSVWAKAASPLIYGYKSSTRAYGNPVISYSVVTATTNGNRMAMKIVLTSGLFSTVTVVGIRLAMDPPTTTGTTFKIGIWDGSGVIQSVTLNADVVFSLGSTIRQVEVYFPTAVTLTAGTTYYAGIEVTGNQTSLWTALVLGATELLAFGGGSMFQTSTYNGSVWADDSTRRPEMELILSDISAPAGGGLMRVDMSGGTI